MFLPPPPQYLALFMPIWSPLHVLLKNWWLLEVLYDSGPMVRHYALNYGFHTFLNLRVAQTLESLEKLGSLGGSIFHSGHIT